MAVLTMAVLTMAPLAAPARAEDRDAQNRISLDPARTFQTLRGWETTPTLLWPDRYDPYIADIFDGLVADFGITRLRLEIYSGAENLPGAFTRYAAGILPYVDWRPVRYATVNDDADPFHINPDGFDFAMLDWEIEASVLPLRTRAAARGTPMEVSLTYVAFTRQIVDGAYIHTDPEEYGEFILAAFLHMQTKYGFVPDALEVLLEPENSPLWTPESLGRAVAATSRRLIAAGFRPRIIAPSVTDARNAIPWIEGMLKAPGAGDLLAELSYHRYLGGRRDVVGAIAEKAAAQGLETSMLELWFNKADYHVLHSDLVDGNVSVWQGFGALGHYEIDPARPEDQRLSIKDVARYDRQYMAHIQPGARRIAALSGNPALFDPVAFINPNGAYTVVIKAEAAGAGRIADLPAGAYYLSYATDTGSVADLAPAFLAKGGEFAFHMPGKGVLTVTALAP